MIMTSSNPRPILAVACLLAALSSSALAQSPDNMVPDPDREERMEWWNDARFGLFIHWGLYSIPAGEWKGEVSKKNYAEWAMHNFEIPLEEYKELAKEFNPVKFDADFVAELAKDAGMGYFVLTTKHHDGFAMFDSDVNDYNIVDATPFKRDVFGELATAFRERGMRVGAYYSQDIDWSVPQGSIKSYNTWDFDVAKGDKGPFDEYMHNKSLPQVEEIVTNYGQVDVIWFDVPRTVDRERGKLFHDLVRKHQPNAVINGRIAVPQGVWADYLVPGDNGYYTSPQDFAWECCATINESWGYTKHEKHPKSIREVIEVLLKSVSAGGNLLLNIGPMADGTIPEVQVNVLREIAAWMKHNSEAIHGTEANPFGEFFDFGYCTVKGGDVYLHVTEWEEGKVITLPRLVSPVEKVAVLGDPDRTLKWQQKDGDVKIQLAGEALHSSATVIKVSTGGAALSIAPLQLKESDDLVILKAKHAKSSGQRMSTLRHYIVESKAVAHFAGGHPSERLTWNFEIDQPGTFKVVAECMQEEPKKMQGRTAFLNFGKDKEIETGIEGEFPEDGTIEMGTIELDGGENQLALRVSGGRGNQSLYLRAFHLERIE